MLVFILRRLAQSAFVMLAVAFIAFALFNYVGDPVSGMVGQDASLEDRQKLRHDLGLDDPFPVQYARFVGNAIQGEFGVSYQQAIPVDRLILEKMPATLELSLAAALFALLIGVPMGVYTALHQDGLLVRLFMTVSLVGISLPTFVIGILLILVFSVNLGWLPSFGRGEVVRIGWGSTGFLTAS